MESLTMKKSKKKIDNSFNLPGKIANWTGLYAVGFLSES